MFVGFFIILKEYLQFGQHTFWNKSDGLIVCFNGLLLGLLLFYTPLLYL